MILTQLQPAVRAAVVRLRIRAMTEGVKAVERLIDEQYAAAPPDTRDALAVAVLKAELLHLDCCDSEALAVFEKSISPHLGVLPDELAVVVAENKFAITAALLSPDLDEWYHLADQHRLIDAPKRDAQSLLSAAEAAEEGKHYEALPTYWRHVLRAYEDCSWRRFAAAENDMARECLALRLPDEAAYHAMLARGERRMNAVGRYLLRSGSPELVRKTLDRVLGCSALRHHATMVAKLLAETADIVPDDRLGAVIEWLIRWCPAEVRSWADAPHLHATWGAVARLAARFGPSEAARFAEIAMAHHSFQLPTPDRTYIIKALNACVGRVGASEIPRISNAVLPLSDERKSDFDYTDVVELLCHLADRADEQTKRRMKSRLYPPGTKIRDSVLLQVAPVFGCKPSDAEALDKNAQNVATALRKQVQRLVPGEEPASLCAYGTVNATRGEGRLVVHIGGCQFELEAVIAHRQSLSDAVVAEVAGAIIDMVADSDNVIVNRFSLVQSLQRFADRLSRTLCETAARVLKPLAEGQITESAASMSHADAVNPLNPFKLNSGDPADLRAASLMALASLELRHPGLVPDLHGGLLLAAMSDPNATVRRCAFAAASGTAQLSTAEQVAAMVGTADSDPQVAAKALSVFDKAGRLQLDQATWGMLARCLERCGTSQHPTVRCWTARVARGACEATLPPDVSQRLHAVKEVLSHDSCFSVRRATQPAPPRT